MENFYIGQIFNGAYPAEVATWCAKNNAWVDEIGERVYEIKEYTQPVPTHDEQSKNRALAYQQEVDPITAHIQRLRDIDPVPQDEIDELIAERDAKVEEIKQRYPYPTDPITEQ
jgi:hypothetical protein